jgi:hypothetical protein
MAASPRGNRCVTHSRAGFGAEISQACACSAIFAGFHNRELRPSFPLLVVRRVVSLGTLIASLEIYEFTPLECKAGV